MNEILLLGDSITQRGFEEGGWTAALANRYLRRADVINRGHGGFNTRWTAALLRNVEARSLIIPERFCSSPALFGTVFFGANDATMKCCEQHVPLEEYKDNLAFIVSTMLQSVQNRRVIVITPPPIDEPKWLQQFNELWGRSDTEANRTTQNAQLYGEAAKEVAAQLNVPVIDMCQAVLAEGETWREALSDGLHLTPKGNGILFAEVNKCIARNWPEIKATKLPMAIPHWTELKL